MSLLGQEKLEHAVLYALCQPTVQNAPFLTPLVIQRYLGIDTEQQVRLALRHLEQCGLAREQSGPDQENWEVTREGVLRVEQHAAQKSSFVGRLVIHGPSWLKSDSALKAQLHSTLTPKSTPTAVSGPDNPQDDRLTVTISPTFTNSPTLGPSALVQPQNSHADEIARSGAQASWANVWVAIGVGVVVVLVSLWVAGKLPL